VSWLHRRTCPGWLPTVGGRWLPQVILTTEEAGVYPGPAQAAYNGLTLAVFSRYTYSR